MVEKYIIDKTDIHDLLTGQELPLSQGKARAFCVEIAGELTNGELIKAMFPDCEISEHFENIPANADDTAMEIINELYDKELYNLGLKVTYASISDPTSIYIEIKPDKELGWYKGSL